MSLGQILDRFAGCDLADPIQRSFVVRDLETLRETLASGHEEALAACLGAATGLASLCRTAGPERAAEISDVVRRLLRLVASEVEQREAAAPRAARPRPQPAGASPATRPGPREAASPRPREAALPGPREATPPGLRDAHPPGPARASAPAPRPAAAPAPPPAAVPAPLPGAAAGPAPEEEPHTLNEMVLGQILVEFGLLSVEQAETAQARCAAEGLRFGEAVVRLGFVSPQDLENATSFQQRLKQNEARKGEGGPTSANLLGQILVRRRLIDAAQLEAALARQEAEGVRLGDALVEAGALTYEALREALVEQHSRR